MSYWWKVKLTQKSKSHICIISKYAINKKTDNVSISSLKEFYKPKQSQKALSTLIMKNKVYEHQIVYNKITVYFYIKKSNILQNN